MKTNILNQHAEHTKWLSEMAFYKDEIKIMQKRIDEVSSKNTSKEVVIQIEHFQNQLLIQDANVSKLIHHINHDENAIQNNIKENPIASDHRKAEDHTEERQMVESFEKHFKELKTELNAF
ncbi:MAG: hypothetical protein IPJ32_05610 [Sphingobacteriaceae bacterium]|nr:hypothetical protein [Sphingobacteriaceae bacterium]